MKMASVVGAPAGPGQRLSTATSFYARTVVDRSGELLGSVTDLMLDLERGRIAYAVVATGGFMGMGERFFAVPWGVLRATGHELVLERDRATLETAPAFDRDHWPVAPASWWHERVHAHYRSRPYWDC
jgi:sporulation protein YlmC with PRC-barrel domain